MSFYIVTFKDGSFIYTPAKSKEDAVNRVSWCVGKIESVEEI